MPIRKDISKGAALVAESVSIVFKVSVFYTEKDCSQVETFHDSFPGMDIRANVPQGQRNC